MNDHSKIKYLTTEEKQRLFRAIDNDNGKYSIRNKAIFYLAEYAGLRASELGLLRLDDINISKREIHFKRLKNSNSNTLRILEDPVYLAVSNYLSYRQAANDTSLYFFHSQKGFPISRKTLDVLMKHYSKVANIPSCKAHFHVLKHTRAVYLADLGLDIKEIRFWLGHKSVKSTEVYFQFTTHQQEQLYQKISFLQ